MSDHTQSAWEISLGQHGELFLFAIADQSDSYRVQRADSTKSPLLTLRSLVRLAVEVIRNKETARQYSYTAIRQMRLRSSQAQKRSLKARVDKIGEYYGGALATEQRNVLGKCVRIEIDADTCVQHVEGDVWRITSLVDDNAPVLSWHALVTLAVQILRDPFLENLFPNLYVPYLRTPDEALEFGENENEQQTLEEVVPVDVTKVETVEQDCTCTRVSNEQERRELEAFLEELVTREERLKQNEARYHEELSVLRGREHKLHRLEQHLFSLRAKIQEELPQQGSQGGRKTKKRSRHRR